MKANERKKSRRDVLSYRKRCNEEDMRNKKNIDLYKKSHVIQGYESLQLDSYEIYNYFFGIDFSKIN